MANVAKDCGDSLSPPFQITQALKEWAVAIEALCSGKLMVLLRKGGIRDPTQPFARIPAAAVLFPTAEHQDATLLQQPNLISSDALPLDAPNAISLKAWVHITHRFAVQSPTALTALMPFHIWSEKFVVERLKWRPHQPLQVLCVRTYRLPEPILLQRSPSDHGCRSWVDLETPIVATAHTPVLSDTDYESRLQLITAALQPIDVNFS
jgi:hypothetical protein